MMKTEKLNLVSEWDKVFKKSNKVNHSKVTFANRYGITLAADMYVPKDVSGKLPALAVSGPFGAVKEQSSGLYAQIMAERGYLTIAFDASFTGESGGEPRYVASPDINTEDFQAAIDTRIKANLVSTMYDIARVTAKGYFDSADSEDARYSAKLNFNKQRTEDFKNGSYIRGGGVADILPADAPYFVKDYHTYYKTERGYHVRSLNSNEGWNVTGTMSFINQPILQYSNEIRSAVLIMHGDKAHSYYFGKDAYENMIKDSKYAENKELLTIEGANHIDLYDNLEVIPFDKIQSFFDKNLK